MVVRNEQTDVDRMFHALADATRRDILVHTIQREQSVSTLAGRYDMSFAAVQKHVAVLERAHLIVKQRRGREQLVHGNAAALRRVTDLLDSYERLWTQRAHHIADLLAEQKGTNK